MLPSARAVTTMAVGEPLGGAGKGALSGHGAWRTSAPGCRQSVLGKTRPHGNKQAHATLQRIVFRFTHHRFGVWAQNTKREGIGKDPPLFYCLVSRTMSRNGPSRPARLSLLHVPRLHKAEFFLESDA
jgi:hypothetical protein